MNRSQYGRLNDYSVTRENTGALTVKSFDPGATAAPELALYRDSPSPAGSDQLGLISWFGNDSGGAVQAYARLQVQLNDPTAASEDASLFFQTVDAGTLGTRMTLTSGLVVGAATGGDQGAGTVNATAVYDDGAGPLTDYVFDIAVDGVAKPDDELMASRFNSKMLEPAAFGAFWRKHRRMPAMPTREEWEDRRLSIGALAQRLWETVEVQAVHIDNLLTRIEALEARGK